MLAKKLESKLIKKLAVGDILIKHTDETYTGILEFLWAQNRDLSFKKKLCRVCDKSYWTNLCVMCVI